MLNTFEERTLFNIFIRLYLIESAPLLHRTCSENR